MGKKIQLTANEKRLVRRYLIWCYKTTKEELDRIDRYFTQSKADQLILNKLKSDKEYVRSGQGAYVGFVNDFQKYMVQKEQNAVVKKFADFSKKSFQPQYQYLQKRCEAIEQTISCFLGAKELARVISLYEEEMTKRILEAREHP
jgi:hypothetical protein